MKVPLFDSAAINENLYGEFEAFFSEFVRSGNFILGEAVQGFEKHVAEQIGCKHAIGVSSGTDALMVALATLDIGPGDEVLCPSFTFFATASSVARLGATPVWVDSKEDDFLIDLEDAQRKISEKTKAILPVHLFGQSCDAEAVLAFAEKHKLFIIEDVAQAQGALFRDRQAGSWGHINAFSFFPTKNLGGLGDAGLLTTNDDNWAEKARYLRVHGSPVRYEHIYLGGNFRMDTLQAALLDLKLAYLPEAIRMRRENAALYLKGLEALSNHLALPQEKPGRFHTWNQFTIRVFNGQREALKSYLEQEGIGCGVYYPKTLDLQPCFQGISTDKAYPTRVAHRLAGEVLSLPIFPGLTSQQIAYVCECIEKFFNHLL